MNELLKSLYCQCRNSGKHFEVLNKNRAETKMTDEWRMTQRMTWINWQHLMCAQYLFPLFYDDGLHISLGFGTFSFHSFKSYIIILQYYSVRLVELGSWQIEPLNHSYCKVLLTIFTDTWRGFNCFYFLFICVYRLLKSVAKRNCELKRNDWWLKKILTNNAKWR